jgi:hypothetical protein
MQINNTTQKHTVIFISWIISFGLIIIVAARLKNAQEEMEAKNGTMTPIESPRPDLDCWNVYNNGRYEVLCVEKKE